MAFQVRVRFCYDGEEKVISVASSREEFDRFSIKQLKEKLRELAVFPEVTDAGNLWVIYEHKWLKDHQSFGSCLIQPQSLLEIQFQFVGQGKTVSDEDRGISRTRSMEILASMEQTDPESENQCCVL